MISLAFDPLTPYHVAFLVSEFSSILPFRRPLIHPIPFRTQPVTHLSLFNNLSYSGPTLRRTYPTLPYIRPALHHPTPDLTYTSNLSYTALGQTYPTPPYAGPALRHPMLDLPYTSNLPYAALCRQPT